MADLATLLLQWYHLHARPLPWRATRDPYAVWVSEIMLQQTRVETVIPYYLRWMERFPTLQALAAASVGDVLALWEGLGYYSRARNLHRAAQVVMREYGGEIPSTLEGLTKLPGIGRYTAGAIASIAFGVDTPALDANLRRVYARLFNVEIPARSAEGEALLWKLAQEHIPQGKAGDYNQALMDLGASLCLPRKPRCLLCPVAELCQARALGVQEIRPVLQRKPPIPHITVAAAVLERDGRFLLARRPENGLLGGLWEFPGGKQQAGETLPGCLRRELGEELAIDVAVGEELGMYRHTYTHFHVTLHAFRCNLVAGEPQPLEHSALAWVTSAELKNYPMGKIDRMIARTLTG